MTSSLQILTETVSSPLPAVQQANDIQRPLLSRQIHEETTSVVRDDRSSSLSDPEDRPIAEGIDTTQGNPSPASEDDDTEAETERLEESPQKLRKRRIVVLNAAKKPIEERTQGNGEQWNANGNPIIHAGDRPITIPSIGQSIIEDDGMEQTSEISSLEDTAEEASEPESPSSVAGRKRKRSSREAAGEKDSATVESLKRAASHLASSMSQNKSRPEIPGLPSSVKDEMVGHHGYDDDEASLDGGEDANNLLHPTLFIQRKGQQFDKKRGSRNHEESESRAVSPGLEDVDFNGSVIDAVESIAGDADMEDIAPEMENDTAIRNEEEGELLLFEAQRDVADKIFLVLKKKAAMDSLSTIEKQFATLRDKSVLS